ncbi:HD-GYP domain-containing protein [Caldanaerobacter subterraneus]|uniref:Putative nucleotidyltransferase with HDIG domain n=1 Tax=Caldanaerobacter subterraneus TaxID=911092 RepID=A0A4R2K4W3_9THEO|nr:HD domain-containing phosphohydrolase [Caldanaerobacter subterraneus]TCO68243.1 putative nucleotidyltransferase with HDIG domain [Caldanaerobacter subterraneus]
MESTKERMISLKHLIAAASTTNIQEELKQHQMRVSKICEKIARVLKMHYDSMVELLMAAQLHDIGKLWIPQQILDKPEKLDEKEMKIIKRHVFYGYEYVKSKKMNSSIAEAVLYHHERFDGKGYIGLKSKEIPLFSRIIAVADAFDAMTNDRPYRKALSLEEAVEEIKKNSGTQFDPEIADTFIKLGVYKINK